MPDVKKLFSLLVCPQCKSKLLRNLDSSRFECVECSELYFVENGIPIMLASEDKRRIEAITRAWNPRGYSSKILSYKTIQLLKAPAPFIWFKRKEVLSSVFAKIKPGEIYLDVGGIGELNHEHIFNVNIMGGSKIHLIADAGKMPFPDESIDGIFLLLIMEHLPSPFSVSKEVFRILKRGGFIFATLPFMQVLHANPKDYFRFTPDGIRELFQGFEEERLEIASGPSSSLVWLLKEYIALLCPFSNNDLVYFSVRELAGWILYPLVFFDLFLNRKKKAEKIASYFYYQGVKK